MDCEISAVLTNANQTLPLRSLRKPNLEFHLSLGFSHTKCPVGKALAMELLKPKRPVKGMVVASEKHEDESPIYTHSFC